MFADFCACSPSHLYYLVYMINISVTSIKQVNQNKNILAGPRVII